ncbi:uncharacterized protein Z520_05300 [Fonsecaea multimorphosa CBS 102226]|uniref:Fungal N-terminal domain-containing protein n=1 Tax=Fonsecaea multimorphosa CBS 102226 TaxID=1442371 RepID=A0A0D2K6R9_9EURO|nr:uncharacterized protein Z520_05300 [Fonsecaea multimorphosa CBS 102226]KIX98839.1 hypothetical protein Z520_05300 [Fonsecaea multimorphosa CBS 102226]OAL25119.1 hypothetical protein AYO22_04996 [Fonsecaea multimorphosa]
MSRSLGFSGSPSPTSLAEACKLAWHTFYGMQKASEDFENLRFEVWTIAISLDSLHSVGSTSLLIDRQPDHKRWALTFSKILTSLNGALRPLYNLVKLYLSTSTRDRAAVKQWLTNTDMNYEGLTVQDFRRKLSMLVESLNVFLSSLTHAELARARAASETEEYRVLSEVTRNVLQKWDQDRSSIAVAHGSDRATTSIGTVAFVHDTVKENSTPSLRGDSAWPRTQEEYPTLWPTHQKPEQHHHGLGHSAETLNLDGIETGFRKHMNAMRRIREQLRLQKENKHHLSDQKSTHFPEVHGETLMTPITPSHHRTMPPKLHASSELPSDHGYTSSSAASSAQTSESGSVISGGSQEDRPKSPLLAAPTTANHTRSSSGELGRKRVRTQDLHLGKDSDDWERHRKPRKTALEEMLTAALFFDS